jgi:hypothetical protein
MSENEKIWDRIKSKVRDVGSFEKIVDDLRSGDISALLTRDECEHCGGGLAEVSIQQFRNEVARAF